MSEARLEHERDSYRNEAMNVRGYLCDAVKRSERAEATLRRIIAWDEAEKPHKNLPLLDCADLARAALLENKR